MIYSFYYFNQESLQVHLNPLINIVGIFSKIDVKFLQSALFWQPIPLTKQKTAHFMVVLFNYGALV